MCSTPSCIGSDWLPDEGMIQGYDMAFPASRLDCNKNFWCSRSVVTDFQNRPISKEIFKFLTQFNLFLLVSFSANKGYCTDEVANVSVL